MKSNRVIAIQNRPRDNVGNVVTTLAFRNNETNSKGKLSGFETKLYGRLKARQCRPSTLPNTKRLINKFMNKGSNEIIARLVREDKRKMTQNKKRLFKALKIINDNPCWMAAQSDKINR